MPILTGGHTGADLRVRPPPAGLFQEADADGSGGLARHEFRTVIRRAELGLSTA